MEALPEIVTEHLAEVRALCEKYSVKRLAVFGSAVQGTFDPATSDLDFAVEFLLHPDPIITGRRYLELWERLESLFQRRIDLVTVSEIRNPYIVASIRRAERSLYAAA